jgi:hypothetical protein
MAEVSPLQLINSEDNIKMSFTNIEKDLYTYFIINEFGTYCFIFVQQEKHSSKVANSVNPRWTNLILHGVNGDTGTRMWRYLENL